MTAAELFVLTGLNAFEWVAVIVACTVICAAAISTHRRDRRRHRDRHPSS